MAHTSGGSLFRENISFVCPAAALLVISFWRFTFSWVCVDTLPVCRPCRVFPSNGEKWKSERVSQHFSLIFYITRGEIDIITTMSAITPSRLVEKSFRRNKKRSFPLVMRCNFLKIRLSMREIVSKWTQPYLRLEYRFCLVSIRHAWELLNIIFMRGCVLKKPQKYIGLNFSRFQV